MAALLDQPGAVTICILNAVRACIHEHPIRLSGNPFPRRGDWVRTVAAGWFTPGGLLRLEADLDRGSMRFAVVGEDSGGGEAGAPCLYFLATRI